MFIFFIFSPHVIVLCLALCILNFAFLFFWLIISFVACVFVCIISKMDIYERFLRHNAALFPLLSTVILAMIMVACNSWIAKRMCSNLKRTKTCFCTRLSDDILIQSFYCHLTAFPLLTSHTRILSRNFLEITDMSWIHMFEITNQYLLLEYCFLYYMYYVVKTRN